MRIIGAFAGGVVLLSVLLGLPVALLIVQRALWRGFDVAAAVEQPLTPPVLVLAGVGAGWLLWGWLVAATIADVAAALTRGPRQPRLLPAPLRETVTALAGSLLLATTANTANTATPTLTASTYAADPPPAAATRSASESVTALPRLTVTGAHASSTAHRRATVLVRHGDSLWRISKQELGDPQRWPEVFHLNQGHPQANGYALTDPDEIHVGWTLVLPTLDPEPAVPDTGPADSTDATTAPAVPAPGTAASPAINATTAPNTTSSAPTNTPDATTPTANIPATDQHTQRHTDRHSGVHLPSQGWISLGLAATIAAVAGLLRLRRRRHARLGAPIPVGTGPTRPPVPTALRGTDATGSRLDPGGNPNNDDEHDQHADQPGLGAVAAPIGVDAAGIEVSLFDLAGVGLALNGPGAAPVARAMLGSALATGVLGPPSARPVVTTTPSVLARLLPAGVELTGLDPHAVTYDGERLLVLADTKAVITHAEEELIGRRRLLDTYDAESITDLNSRTDHAEQQPPYVLLIEACNQHSARVAAIAAHRTALHIHVVVLGTLDGIPTLTVSANGTPTTASEPGPVDGGRLATLTATDLEQLLAMIADAAPRPEPGAAIDEPTTTTDADEMPPADLGQVPDLPTSTSDTPASVRLTVLGPVTLTTAAGPVTTGMRTGSYAVLALLAAHPHGRTLKQIAADLHPDVDPDAAVKRVRTDINTARHVLRTATGITDAMFVIHDPASRRYRLDPDLIDVDLWRMLTAISRANTATADTTALAALGEAADLYGGDLADGQAHAWITDYATTHRHQILNVYARIAELLEADQPDAAVAALETALRHDPVNEELYQRIIRIHGRQHRPDAVRRTLRRLEDQLAELGGAEPSEATRRIADRQLRPVPAGARA